MEEGGQVIIPPNAIFSIDLNSTNARFENYGSLLNSGTLLVVNTANKSLLNEGIIECENGGECRFLD